MMHVYLNIECNHLIEVLLVVTYFCAFNYLDYIDHFHEARQI